MGEIVIYKYLHESNISQEEYCLFLHKFYGVNAKYRCSVRYSWYKKYLGFHCLLAIYNGKLIGQSCAFRVRMNTPSGEVEWWWGCDSFVLAEARGKGVGKGLQQKLFEDHPNFSSIGYSRINGIIKRKVGARTVAHSYPSLYAIDCYFPMLFSLIISKLTGKTKNILLPKCHCHLLCNSIIRNVKVSESVFTEKNCAFIMKTLSERYSYYVIRDAQYLHWKYDENPSVRYHLLELKHDDRLVGVIITSIAFDGTFHGYKLKMAKLLDVFIDPSFKLGLKSIIVIVDQFFRQNNQPINGIYGISKGDYIWTLKYPMSGKEVLSSYDGFMDNIYLSLSDQDLDQIPFIENSYSNIMNNECYE